MKPDRLAVFSYAHVPWVKPAQKILEQQQSLPAPETKLQVLKLVIEKLTANDRYVYIGMDHFARPGDELAVAQRSKTAPAQFPGLQHPRRRGHLRVRHVEHLADPRRPTGKTKRSCRNTSWRWTPARVPVQRGYLVTEEDAIRRETIMRVMCDLVAGLRRDVAAARD